MFKHLLNFTVTNDDKLPVYAVFTKPQEDLTETNFSRLKEVISAAMQKNQGHEELIGASCIISLYRLFNDCDRFCEIYNSCLHGLPGIPDDASKIKEFLDYVDNTTRVSGDDAPAECMRLKTFYDSGNIPVLVYIAGQQSIFNMCVNSNLFSICLEAVRFMTAAIEENRSIYDEAVHLHLEFFCNP